MCPKLLCSLFFTFVALAPGIAFTAQQEWEELFDGSSLAGWQGDGQHWRIEDGAIVGEIPQGQTLRRNTWLLWKGGQLKDFDLRLQVKLSGAPAANSGIQFRCQVQDVNHVSGYQADLDQGTTWLGRIYDEHGRALLVERGARVLIDSEGNRSVQQFAPANQYSVLFRDRAWNDYRIVAIGERIAVFVNGTLFSELVDRQTNQRDLEGALAFQLHSGPQTKVEFRNIRLQRLEQNDPRLGKFKIDEVAEDEPPEVSGNAPKNAAGEDLNLGFESGSLNNWQATGNAFDGQPVDKDGIQQRWPGQNSNKQGKFFIGGFEKVQDGGTGTLTSASFTAAHPFASFLIAGGDSKATRVDVVRPATDTEAEQVIYQAVGNRREQMRRVVVDLRDVVGKQIAVRLVDESDGPWGHLNFDDFRFHDTKPEFSGPKAEAWRSTHHPLLHHLVPNPDAAANRGSGNETTRQMFVPEGFSVGVVAAEPQVHQPMAFTFDAKGRLWVVEGHSYPKKRPEGEGLDRVLIFADENGDGDFETRKVFCEGLNLVSGLEVGHGGVWVGAAPELLFIPDRDQDDHPDSEPVVLLDGFGYADTHETINSFMWGPDGWLYGNQGVFNSSQIGKPGTAAPQRTHLAAGVWRYHPTRHEFEVFAHGGSNQWGLDYDQLGQIFMTHCRSYFGKGSTTHVIAGGHYWNQVNSGYASFICNTPVAGMEHMVNYMLASARYGHGEGGAGKKGSRAVYGGHSHVGTMIYLGDNWPSDYRNHLFSHNLHGHQINRQVNRREAGGYNTLHAGQDTLFCADRQYIGVDLQYGPDGAVYITDWYDPRHCHNPDVEQWDRGNGRIYRMKYDASYQPVTVDYAAASDDQLVQAQLHANAWHARIARLVLAEHAAEGQVAESTVERLRKLAIEHDDVAIRLRAVWGVHAAGAMDVDFFNKLLTDDSEYVRGWAIQLGVESLNPDTVATTLMELAGRETSLWVRRYLASAAARLPDTAAWRLLDVMSSQRENAEDRELPLLMWYALAPLVDADLSRALALAETTEIVAIRDYLHWYASQRSSDGREAVMQSLLAAEDADRTRLLSLFAAGIRGMRKLDQPTGWSQIAASLYDSPNAQARSAAYELGAAFADKTLFSRMRVVLDDASSSLAEKRQALSILAGDESAENLPYLLRLLDSPQLAVQATLMLKRFNKPVVAEMLIQRLPNWSGKLNDSAMEVLCSRSDWAEMLLEAIAKGRIAKNQLSAFYARQMSDLGDQQLSQRLTSQWGRLGQSSAQRKEEIKALASAYKSAPLWAYNRGAGEAHFKKLCATCHPSGQTDEHVAPKLAGTGSKGIDYIVENIIDPNAVIGKDFQARIVLTVEGQVITGLVLKETDSAYTIRTATSETTVAKDDIERITVSENSFMPQELLQSLNDRQRIELLKYLMTL